MLSKNLPLSEKCWKIPFRILLDNLSGIQALFNGNPKTWFAILSAHIGFFNWVFKKKMKKNFPKMKLSKMCGVYAGSVVWQYFINKKKTFSKIISLKK